MLTLPHHVHDKVRGWGHSPAADKPTLPVTCSLDQQTSTSLGLSLPNLHHSLASRHSVHTAVTDTGTGEEIPPQPPPPDTSSTTPPVVIPLPRAPEPELPAVAQPAAPLPVNQPVLPPPEQPLVPPILLQRSGDDWRIANQHNIHMFNPHLSSLPISYPQSRWPLYQQLPAYLPPPPHQQYQNVNNVMQTSPWLSNLPSYSQQNLVGDIYRVPILHIGSPLI